MTIKTKPRLIIDSVVIPSTKKRRQMSTKKRRQMSTKCHRVRKDIIFPVVGREGVQHSLENKID